MATSVYDSEHTVHHPAGRITWYGWSISSNEVPPASTEPFASAAARAEFEAVVAALPGTREPKALAVVAAMLHWSAAAATFDRHGDPLLGPEDQALLADPRLQRLVRGWTPGDNSRLVREVLAEFADASQRMQDIAPGGGTTALER